MNFKQFTGMKMEDKVNLIRLTDKQIGFPMWFSLNHIAVIISTDACVEINLTNGLFYKVRETSNEIMSILNNY